MFVLVGALLVAAPGVWVQRSVARPAFDDRFHLPQKAVIDLPLIGGAAFFGVGWGLAGQCQALGEVDLSTLS